MEFQNEEDLNFEHKAKEHLVFSISFKQVSIFSISHTNEYSKAHIN